jgi:hypothetical protein
MQLWETIDVTPDVTSGATSGVTSGATSGATYFFVMTPENQQVKCWV